MKERLIKVIWNNIWHELRLEDKHGNAVAIPENEIDTIIEEIKRIK